MFDLNKQISHHFNAMTAKILSQTFNFPFAKAFHSAKITLLNSYASAAAFVFGNTGNVSFLINRKTSSRRRFCIDG